MLILPSRPVVVEARLEPPAADRPPRVPPRVRRRPVAQAGPGRSKGSPRSGRERRAAALYPVGLARTRTMMQPCASAAKLRGGGPILTSGIEAVQLRGTPPPRIVTGRPGLDGGGRRRFVLVSSGACGHGAGRRTTVQHPVRETTGWASLRGHGQV